LVWSKDAACGRRLCEQTEETTVKVKNITRALQGIRTEDGLVYVPAGQVSRELRLGEAHRARLGKLSNIFEVVEDRTPDAPTGQTPPVPPLSGLEARHKGAGSYSIYDSEGTELVEKLAKAQADEFNKMTDEQKTSYVRSVTDA
jgi:hypothetical protein